MQFAPLPTLADCQASLDRDLQSLAAHRQRWVQTKVAERIALLSEIKECLMPVAQAWAETASRMKGIATGSPLEGEEWLSGPYALMSYCNQMRDTLARVQGKRHLDGLPLRELPNGQLAARVLPHSIWDRLLLSGVSAEVWMQPGVNRGNLAAHTAAVYDSASPAHKTGKLALVLGAGNVASIAPLDVLHKLFAENEVAMLKLNPVNDYLLYSLTATLGPLIERGFVRIVRGGTDVGQYLCEHPLVETLHITGAGASHDAIVWGPGEQGRDNKAAGTPRNARPITSELGAVCPTIVVPGPWSAADIRFQAEQVATQKLNNSGFNCVACQVLVLPRQWAHKNAFLQALRTVIAQADPRPAYYPGTEQRLSEFRARHPQASTVARRQAPDLLMTTLDSADARISTEVFAPALQVIELDAPDPPTFLAQAIAFANERLYGTLGANLVIDPATRARIGQAQFESLLADLRYGTIAINTWTGLGFATPQAPWGAFPGHTLDDVQSGIGVVHNTLLFDKPERVVIEAPFRPFPRGLLSRSLSVLPRPPWFITNRRAAVLGRLLVDFQWRPRVWKLPRLFMNALRG